MLYEDLPYAADPDDGRASAWLDAVAGVRLHRIAADTLRRKAAAVRAYASQLHLLAGADDPVERALVRHALRVGGGAPAERAWRWSRGAGGNPPAAVPGQHAANPPTARRKRSMDRTDVTASGWLAEARAGLLRDGVVVLRNTGLEGFARSVGEQMLAELDLMLPFESDFTVYAKGHLRQYPPVGPEAHVPELLGAEPVLALVNAVLNGPYVASYQGHTVLPGAHAQPVHADWEPLWPELDRPVPPFLLAVNIALQHTDEANGSVEIWPGTHLVPPRGLYQPGSLRIRPEHLDRRRAEVPPTYVDLEPGDVLVRDALTWHRGTTNASGSARPMLWLLLAQSWFRAEHDDELVLPAALRPAIERLPVGLACRYEAEPFDHLRLPDPADVRSGSRDRGASV
jgi:hypothetical protein